MKDDYTIIIDTREQTGYFLKEKRITFEKYKENFSDNQEEWIKYLNEKLGDKYNWGTIKTGDYSIDGHKDKICIERKSLGDLFGTLGKGNKRFKKELERARELDYFAIIIEGSFRDVRDKNFKGSEHSKMRGDIIIKILFTLIVKYKIHVFFCNDRNESRAVIKQLFEAYLRSI